MIDKEKYWKENWLTRANNYLGLSQRMLDLEWVDKQILKGRLATGYRQTIEILTPVLESIYPGRWDIQFDTTLNFATITNLYRPVEFDEVMYNAFIESYGGTEEGLEEYLSYSNRRRLYYLQDIYMSSTKMEHTVPTHLNIANVYIIIHFPEATITNSKEESLVIKDMFTRTILQPDGKISTRLYGSRSTFTIPEMSTGYVHSHLHSITWGKLKDSPLNRMPFTQFCLGESDLITFAQLYNGSKDLGNFESYLYMLQTVVSWESIEGGPHIRIKNTIQKSLDVPNVTIDSCKETLQRLTGNTHSANYCPIDWVFRDNKYVIVDNEKFEDFVRSAYNYDVGSPTTVYKDENGRYFTPSTISEEIIQIKHQDFVPFRGQKFQLKIEGELKLVDKHKWYINPKIKQYVKSKLESVCNKIETKKYSIEWLNQVNNNRGVYQQS